jgi:hypothetical protein
MINSCRRRLTTAAIGLNVALAKIAHCLAIRNLSSVHAEQRFSIAVGCPRITGSWMKDRLRFIEAR